MGSPPSVGHIMTFYCVVRRKSAYYACATASYNCGVPLLRRRGGLQLESRSRLPYSPHRLSLLFTPAIVLQINIILWYRVCFANCCMCGVDCIYKPRRRRRRLSGNSGPSGSRGRCILTVLRARPALKWIPARSHQLELQVSEELGRWEVEATGSARWHRVSCGHVRGQECGKPPKHRKPLMNV